MFRRIRHRLEWFLCTDFESHEPLDKDAVHTVLFFITLCLILGA